MIGLKPHPNSPRGRAGREATRIARLDSNGRWAESVRVQNERSRRPSASANHRVQIADECFDDAKADERRRWREADRNRGAIAFSTSCPTRAARGKPMMRVTFVRPTAFGDFEYGYYKPHRSGDPARDKAIVWGVRETQGEAQKAAGGLV